MCGNARPKKLFHDTGPKSAYSSWHNAGGDKIQPLEFDHISRAIGDIIVIGLAPRPNTRLFVVQSEPSAQQHRPSGFKFCVGSNPGFEMDGALLESFMDCFCFR